MYRFSRVSPADKRDREYTNPSNGVCVPCGHEHAC
jgi:hypothetical protein